jgi:hypothetical protein
MELVQELKYALGRQLVTSCVAPVVRASEIEPFYVHVRGFEEIGNASYTGEPDYVLSGWQRMLWFLVKQGQVGFAFSPPQDDIMMLHNRDVYQRVQDILISGLTTDRARCDRGVGLRGFESHSPHHTRYPVVCCACLSSLNLTPHLGPVALISLKDCFEQLQVLADPWKKLLRPSHNRPDG